MNRFLLSLSIAALALLSAPSRAGDAQWEVIRFYHVSGRTVPVAVPAAWQDLSGLQPPRTRRSLRFMDEYGEEREVSLSALAHASANKPMVGAQEFRGLALKARQ